MTTKSEMFERVIIDLSDLQSDLSSAEACEDTSAQDQAVANKLWDVLEATLEQVYQLERRVVQRKQAISDSDAYVNETLREINEAYGIE